MKLSLKPKLSFNPKNLGLAALAVVATGVTALALVSWASGAFATIEPENGTLTGGSSSVTDATASGGKAVLFSTPSTPTPAPTPAPSGWPNASNTGYAPTGVTLHSCPTSITAAGTYDSCLFNGGLSIHANNVHITRSLINGQIGAGSGRAGEQTGLVISDTTIDCGCLADNTSTPAAIEESNYTLLRVNLMHSGHGASVKDNVVIQDSYIHDLGANSEAHKDGIFSGDGTNVTIRHNNIECNDGPIAGCTSAIGLLVDFGTISYYTIDNNLLNTNGSYCFYGGGGPQKPYKSDHITFTNNHFGRKNYPNCGYYGPVTYWDSSQPGMVWSGNVWDDTGALVPPEF